MTKREPNVANVWWLPGETLHCLQCAGDIQPVRMDNGKNLYSIYWSTEENRGAYPADVLEEDLERFLKYKFCSQECATSWAFPDGVIPDYHQEAEKILKEVKQLPETRLRVGGFHLGMDIKAAACLLNYHTGQHYRVHAHRGHPDSFVLKNTSDGDSPANEFVFRTLKNTAMVSEIFLHPSLLAKIIGQKISPPENLLAHLKVHFFHEAQFAFFEGFPGLEPWRARRCYHYRNEHFEELVMLGEVGRVQNSRALIAFGGIFMCSLNPWNGQQNN